MAQQGSPHRTQRGHASLAQAVSWLGALVLATFAGLQFNDPDPAVWVAIYAAGSLCCAMSARSRLAWQWPAALASVAVVWALTLTPAVARAPLGDVFGGRGMMAPGIEDVREMMGLFMLASAMVAVALVERRKATGKA